MRGTKSELELKKKRHSPRSRIIHATRPSDNARRSGDSSRFDD
jgi:hypothetical protein